MAKRKKLDHTILAEGEHTGHRHQAHGEGVALYDDGVLEAPHGAEVTHQEHAPLAIPAGIYDKSGVLEYDHFQKEARQVRD